MRDDQDTDTFETDAKSKIVSTVTEGEPARYVNFPNAFNAANCPDRVIATVAPGKACTAIPSARTEKARSKMRS